ncbi:MAG: Mrp/NBP35 family ATP-binding protein [Clostridiaceae bacterium]|nr:Mrp/NBP35 family ATP-binding protein [Clostridiaceae bacterium]
MSQNCDHNCSSCQSDCPDRKMKKEDFLVKPHETANIKKVIGIVSGKGGVGKSFVTSAMASISSRRGWKTAILDSDITGPSIPKAFGLHERAMGTGEGILPVETSHGIKVMSLNLLLEDESAPVVWRGPIIAGTVKQFWTDVLWGDVDFMFIDMPPGTGDVALTVFQSIPLDGIIIVTTPQELVAMIVEKAVNMARLMDIPVIGLVENMSYVDCPDCGKQISLFGKSRLEETAAIMGIANIAKLPIDPVYSAAIDSGKADEIDCPQLYEMMTAVEKI